MYGQPPETCSAAFSPSPSWTAVNLQYPPSCGSISHVTRLGSSAASSGS